MKRKDFVFNEELTNMVDLPGVKIEYYSSDDDTYHCHYAPDPKQQLFCDKCDGQLVKNGYTAPRKVLHYANGKIINLRVQFQILTCRKCGTSGVYSNGLKSEIGGLTYSLVYEIVERCLYSSPEKVLSSFGEPGLLSESEIRRIFRIVASSPGIIPRDKDPRILGLHLLSGGNNHQYFMISDILNQSSIDIFPYEKLLEFQQCLQTLSKGHQIKLLVSDISPECLNAARKESAEVRFGTIVANAGIYRAFMDIMRQSLIPKIRYMKGIKSDYLEWISRSLSSEPDWYEDSIEESRVKDKQVQTWISYQKSLRKMIQGNWNRTVFDSWVKEIETDKAFDGLRELLEYAAPELNKSFLIRHFKEGQLIYGDLDERADQLLKYFPKCSFEILRVRFLQLF